jgi:hypothetical protein
LLQVCGQLALTRLREKTKAFFSFEEERQKTIASPYGQNIRTCLPTGDYVTTIAGASACLPLMPVKSKG